MHCIKDKNNLLTSVITEDYILMKEGNSLPYFNYHPLPSPELSVS